MGDKEPRLKRVRLYKKDEPTTFLLDLLQDETDGREG
jgi:hypothetical protein